MKKINDGVFYGCHSLEIVHIENEEIEIGYDVFGECSSLKEIIINGEKIDLYKFEVNYKQMKRFKQIGIECENIVIRREDVQQYGKEIVNDSRVHRIHDNCFRDDQTITEMVIPTHITSLGMFSFSNCQNLTRVVIPKSIKDIPYCCFEQCSVLKKIDSYKIMKNEQNNLNEIEDKQRKHFSLTKGFKNFMKQLFSSLSSDDLKDVRV